MKTITTKNTVYSMSSRNLPIATVQPGEKFAVITKDCFSNTVKTSRDLFRPDKVPGANPATGPIFIQGAQRSDILAVRILKIEPARQGAMCIAPERGALGKHIPKRQTTIFRINRGRINFDRRLSLPVRPMIGVIGTAPAGREIPNSTPSEHGGNMDCKHITAGSVVYLPVNVKGALLAMGDLHALMADGEVVICGVEVTGKVTCSVDIVKSNVVTPSVRTADKLMILASAKSLDKAQHLVLDKAMRFLTEMVGLSPEVAARLLSLVGDLAVCQVVDPLKTMRVELPLNILRKYGWRGPS